jgi:hypothetical protein
MRSQIDIVRIKSDGRELPTIFDIHGMMNSLKKSQFTADTCYLEWIDRMPEVNWLG